jgi:hypothetical protein
MINMEIKRRRRKPNSFVVKNNTVILFLTMGQRTKIDRNEMERVIYAGKWFAQKSTTTDAFYARRSAGGPLLSRFILGAESSSYVDHWNHDTLDNRKRNLRECTPVRSAHNRRKCIFNTSGLIGVDWHNLVGKWQARITVNKKRIHLGWFDNKWEAGLKRDNAVKQLHGEFGVTNIAARDAQISELQALKRVQAARIKQLEDEAARLKRE